MLDAVGGAVPVVDVSLAPAEAPSELVDAIADFDAERARFEKASEDAEFLAFNAALEAAKPRLDAIAKRVVREFATAGAGVSSRFLSRGVARQAGGARQAGAVARVIEVEVPARKPVDVSALVLATREAEGRAEAASASEVASQFGDFDALTDFVVEHTGGQRRASSFFGAPANADGSAVAFANFGSRRGTSEALMRAKHLALSMALLRRENKILGAALRREVAAARAAGVSFLSTLGSDRYVLELVPPTDDAQDSLARIDDIMMEERAKQVAANSLFASEKQRVLDADHNDIRQVVRGQV